MIIHINGNPGVGKLTVARKLCERINGRLIDNHALIDLVLAVTGRGARYEEMVLAVTSLTYDFVARSCDDEYIVFTNALARSYPADEARLAAAKELADRMGRAFVPVLLSCSIDENARRIVLPDRASKRKLMDPEILRRLASESELIHDTTHPNALSIDTTSLKPEDVARLIAEHAADCTRRV